MGLAGAASEVRLLALHARRLHDVRHRRILDHLDIRSRDAKPMIEFVVYFLAILLFFTFVWKATGWALDKIDEREDRRFREKVDRYRR